MADEAVTPAVGHGRDAIRVLTPLASGRRVWPTTRSAIALLLGVVLALAHAPLAAQSRPEAKVPRIGVLRPGLPFDPFVTFLIDGLHELGYTEGENIAIEYRWAHGRTDRLPALATELVRLNVDVIVVGGTTATRAVQRATSTIPIVMAAVGDPVRSRFVESLARPGGNLTGVTLFQPGLGEKRLRLLKELLPNATRVAVLQNPHSAEETRALWAETEAAARALGLQLHRVEAGAVNELAPAFAALDGQGRADALLVLPDPLFTGLRGRIADLAAKRRVPAMYEAKEFVVAGGLMSYAPSLADQFRRAAATVDKILKGARPGDLPVEQPTKLELVINLRTAKALRLQIPQPFLRRADEIVQ
jgi:putative tryptophan/tyrosine transport system substrate-binding protein